MLLLAFANYFKGGNMKKRVLSLGIVLTMMASSMQTFAEDYSDMPTGWSNAAMTYAVNNGYI